MRLEPHRSEEWSKDLNPCISLVAEPMLSLYIFTFLKKQILATLCSMCGEGNGNPLQYSCLENPTDGGTW